MYERLLKKLEGLFEQAVMGDINEISIEYINNLAELIFKIKSIQTLDKSMKALEDIKNE